jgi:anaerobic selenocysteine-containing dehydrogenase
LNKEIPKGKQTRFATCPLCEATCGLAVDMEAGEIKRIRGDAEDPFSKGYICPKATALVDIQNDPDRIRTPLRRRGTQWEAVSWDTALDEVANRLHQTRSQFGKDAVGFFIGNPTIHSYSALLFGMPFFQQLGTKNHFTANSMDGLPRLVASQLLYGAPTLLPVPDIDRTDFFLLIGANPLVSNGALMTAPNCRARFKALQKRGGQLVVIDPRRTETAKLSQEHHFIRPGSDAYLLLGMINVIFSEDRVAMGSLMPFVRGLDTLRQWASVPLEQVAERTGISQETIVDLARRFTDAKRAVCYGRMGTSTQRFGTLASWLIESLNIISGNLDREGGTMFTDPAFDLVTALRLSGIDGQMGRWHSRRSGLPEFNGELPVAAFADEIETEGERQIKALITHAGNPVLSVPNGKRVDRALEKLDFMVSIDIYLNETTRHANIILPPSFGLEHSHYPMVLAALGVRNRAKFSPALTKPPSSCKHDWEIFVELSQRMLQRGSWIERGIAGVAPAIARKLGPEGVLRLALRAGSYGRPGKFGWRGLSLKTLKDNPHGIDLGPLKPCLPDKLLKKDKTIDLGCQEIQDEIKRLKAADERPGPFHLIGRRQLRGNNSWLHNVPRLTKGADACTIFIHPKDALNLGLSQGQKVEVQSTIGTIVLPCDISDEMMEGAVSIPHGFGHDRPGIRLSVASEKPGVSANDITDETLVDSFSGCSDLNGVSVTLRGL